MQNVKWCMWVLCQVVACVYGMMCVAVICVVWGCEVWNTWCVCIYVLFGLCDVGLQGVCREYRRYGGMVVYCRVYCGVVRMWYGGVKYMDVC